jgi:hypothetical protein
MFFAPFGHARFIIVASEQLSITSDYFEGILWRLDGLSRAWHQMLMSILLRFPSSSLKVNVLRVGVKVS